MSHDSTCSYIFMIIEETGRWAHINIKLLKYGGVLTAEDILGRQEVRKKCTLYPTPPTGLLPNVAVYTPPRLLTPLLHFLHFLYVLVHKNVLYSGVEWPLLVDLGFNSKFKIVHANFGINRLNRLRARATSVKYKYYAENTIKRYLNFSEPTCANLWF